ncbi:hypothetical protein ACG33_11390 [Steroidobacter denitrificans]|uniref:2,3-dihydroxybenzoate-AMP ligase n=1 Tax=Steroidobacter denitrificans TaxID=465721 RepID=A0A127FBA0_STEDE|nr:class I adenylate-forming enzyme family protein [Steroidobacter denitrificans]AMN47692.1 hypothetical protein ACG33_11390 [Steroidobacter denitrificans]
MIIANAERIRDYSARGIWKGIRLGDWLEVNSRAVPDREALVDPPNRAELTGGYPQRLTWGQLAEMVDRFSCLLIAAGLKKGDVAVLQLANIWELPALYLACAKVGIITTPVSAMYRENELTHIVKNTQARALICSARIKKHDHAGMMRDLAAHCSTVEIVLVLGEQPVAGTINLSGMLTSELDRQVLVQYEAAHPVSPDDLVNILWTSGTEGRPKGVARSHNGWTLYADIFGKNFGIIDGCRLLAARQLVTCGSFTAYIVPWLANAGTIVCHHPFDFALFIRQLADERITFTSLAPAILRSLSENIELVRTLDLSNLKYVSSGSAPLQAGIVSALETQLGLQIVNIFGSTEGACLLSFPEDIPAPHLRSNHFPRTNLPHIHWRKATPAWVETRLMDLDSETPITKPGQVGEMRYRGAQVFDGYYNADDLDVNAFDNEGYYRSGDLFEITGDQQQFYRYVGRAKDIVVRGGLNISAAEIEDLLLAHPKIRECAIVGYPDARLGEKVCVFIVPRENCSVELTEINSYLRDEKQIAIFKLPEKIKLVTSLPRSPHGKVLKKLLRHQVAEAECVADVNGRNAYMTKMKGPAP